ncbi:hypothetical protein PHLCEN_2v3435 [Hermanssonia centrifuga]|uniref:Mannosyltransferase n=1 Tax=Hermanssonia centrifuga TaxID=98765 RepID=A0A2R6QIP0_9APHY|nr:hypothetical protein PHLCEN_2v3435 [Hermanssonia centrifuga]
MAALSVAGYGIVDTMYFREDDRLVLTPYNFLLYNLSSENLAQHGLHPRWLHLVVNLPMLTWIIFNIVLSLLFGVLHQGGVVPSLLRLHGLINGESSSNGSAIVYWRTYMPPRHLLGIPEHDVVSGRVRVTDLAGAPPDQVENTLVSLISHRKNTTLYIVTPPFAMQALQSPLSACFAVEKHLFPHLDMDHIPESLEVGWPEGLTLGIYVADSDCIEGHAFSIAH